MSVENKTDITVAGKTVTVHELTVKEIREWLRHVEQTDANDFVNDQLFDEFSLSDLARMSTIKTDDLEGMRPSEIQYLADICKEKNPQFFTVVGKHRKLVTRALGLLDAS